MSKFLNVHKTTCEHHWGITSKPCTCDDEAAKSPEQPAGISESDLKLLDYYLWKRVGYDGAPACKGEYEIRFEDGQATKADYNPDEATFYFAGDYEIHLSKVEWRDIYPASPVERAARAYFAQAKAPKRESGDDKMTQREEFLYNMREEPLREGDLDIVGGLFAIRFRDGCSTGCAEIYVEDDTYYHLKCTIDRLWLKDLENVVKEALTRIEGDK
jgi:hypothetical protein